MLASGAKALLASDEALGPLPSALYERRPGAALSAPAVHPPPDDLTSGHVQATVKMAEDPRLGVVNSRGEAHHLRNLMVCDSSVFPTSCGANPMISILSMARYQGKRIAAERPATHCKLTSRRPMARSTADPPACSPISGVPSAASDRPRSARRSGHCGRAASGHRPARGDRDDARAPSDSDRSV